MTHPQEMTHQNPMDESSQMRLSRIHAVLTATFYTRVVTNGKRLTPEN